ncbi:actin-crosslinking protein [Wilcoxina mikolae CBS 423.85]|nr:actin-crosslinking protein [Wilcoxina mikolae CBS 423.85]
MVSALRFKGEKKPKKRKRIAGSKDEDGESSALAPTSKKASTKKEHDPDEEGWVDSEVLDDLTGPILITLATTPPSCLASDAAGSVFASPLTLITGENLSTAEPSDVQQVWVCARVYGSTTKFTLKSHLGRYLSVDKHGVLSATREAISPEEEFTPVRAELGGGRWAWQTVREKFIGVEEGGKGTVVRGDREEIGFCETWMVRLQKRNKVRVKAGGGGTAGEGGMKDRVTRRELEELAGVKLENEQVKMLRKARREGGFHEALLNVRVKLGKHDKFAY